MFSVLLGKRLWPFSAGDTLPCEVVGGPSVLLWEDSAPAMLPEGKQGLTLPAFKYV